MINHFNIIITIKDSKTWSFILFIIFFWCVILDVFQSVSFLITNITFDFSIVARLEYIILYELYKSRCTISVCLFLSVVHSTASYYDVELLNRPNSYFSKLVPVNEFIFQQICKLEPATLLKMVFLQEILLNCE